MSSPGLEAGSESAQGSEEPDGGPQPLRRSALTDLAVLGVLTAHAGPTGCVTLGCRRIAEEAGYSKDTVSRSLARLRKAGAIEWIPRARDRPTDADSWRVLRPSILPRAEDVWSRYGLGMASRLIHQAMVPDQPYSYTDLRDATGLSRRRVRDALGILESVGWVSGSDLRDGAPTSRTRWTSRRVTPDEMADIAAHLRVDEQRLGRRRWHRQQRLDFYRMVEPFTERTELMHTDLEAS